MRAFVVERFEIPQYLEVETIGSRFSLEIAKVLVEEKVGYILDWKPMEGGGEDDVHATAMMADYEIREIEIKD